MVCFILSKSLIKSSILLRSLSATDVTHQCQALHSIAAHQTSHNCHVCAISNCVLFISFFRQYGTWGPELFHLCVRTAYGSAW